jgi:hypothetical protein
MNKNSMRDVIIYYAHETLGYTAPELSEIYGIGAPYIRQIIRKVRDVESGKRTHGPTSYALKQMQRNYPPRNIEAIKALRTFSKKLEKDIEKTVSAIIAYAPEIQDTPFLDGIYCISDNLENWQEELNAELEKFLRNSLAD